MTIKDVFEECVRRQVPCLPFVDEQGRVTGRVAIRHVLKYACIPDFMVAHADLLGDKLDCLTVPEEHARAVLRMPADRFVSGDNATITPSSPVVKALALMERHKTNYLFVIEGGTYKGIVTIDGIAKRMLELESR